MLMFIDAKPLIQRECGDESPHSKEILTYLRSIRYLASGIRHLLSSISSVPILPSRYPRNIIALGELICLSCHGKQQIAESIQVDDDVRTDRLDVGQRNAMPLRSSTYRARHVKSRRRLATAGQNERTNWWHVIAKVIDIPFHFLDVLRADARHRSACRCSA